MTCVPTENRGVGIVYQDCALFPHLSVIKNITYGLRYHPRAPEKTLKKLINGLNLDPLLQRSVHHLSGGEKQRVAMARALATIPVKTFLACLTDISEEVRPKPRTAMLVRIAPMKIVIRTSISVKPLVRRFMAPIRKGVLRGSGDRKSMPPVKFNSAAEIPGSKASCTTIFSGSWHKLQGSGSMS